jgi:hypothetical protein
MSNGKEAIPVRSHRPNKIIQNCCRKRYSNFTPKILISESEMKEWIQAIETAINRTIGAPYAFRHTMHVVNAEGALQGLPSEWANEGKDGSRATPITIDPASNQVDPFTIISQEIILQRLFKYLSLADILRRVALVSTRWKALAYHNDLVCVEKRKYF